MKNCPFYKTEKDMGHNPYTQKEDNTLWYVGCTCGARGPITATEDMAVTAWDKMHICFEYFVSKNIDPKLLLDTLQTGTAEDIRQNVLRADNFHKIPHTESFHILLSRFDGYEMAIADLLAFVETVKNAIPKGYCKEEL